MDRCQHPRDPAAEPAAEPNDFLLADAASGVGHAVRSATSRRRGSRWSTKCRVDRQGPGVSLDQRARRVAARLPRAGDADARGLRRTLITRFDADVTTSSASTRSSGWLYFLASPSNATQRYLYRSKLDGSGAAGARDAGGSAGHAQLRSRARRAAGVPHVVAVRSRRRVMDVVELPAHRSLRALTDPSALAGEAGRRPQTAGRVPHGGHRRTAWSLDGWMLKPSSFDRVAQVSRHRLRLRRAVRAQTVTDRVGRQRRCCSIARSRRPATSSSAFDNRGTPAPKGAAWRKVVYGTRRRSVVEGTGRRDPRACCASPVHRRRPASASGAGAAAERTRSTRCSVFPTSTRWAWRSRPCPISSSTTRSIRSATWDCRKDNADGYRRRLGDQLRRGAEREAADRSRIGRRQRALSGHRAAGESVRGARQAVRSDGAIPTARTRSPKAPARRRTSIS